MACTYSLNINGQIQQFNDYAELFDFLIGHKNQIEMGLISDIVFSQDTKQSEMVAKLRSIKATAKLNSNGVDPVSGDIMYKAEGSNMSVTDFLETATITKDSKETFLGQPFSIKNWRNNTINELVSKGMTHAEAEEQVNNIMEMWERIADTGAELHAVLGDYFAGHMSLEELIDKYAGVFSEQAVRSIYKNMASFKDEIYKAHGQDAKLLPQFTIDSKTLDGVNIIGSIDLVVIGEDGQPHLYVFKSSAKLSDRWDAAKQTKYDYQLAFYRQMLASKGIPAANMELNIVPMHLEGLEDGELTGVSFEGVQDRTKDSGGTINRLAWGVGEFYNNVSYAIPVRLTDETIGESIRDNVLDTLSKFIPNPKIKSIREQIDVDAFIANHVYDSPNPSEGRWYFKDFYSKGKPIYIKEDSPKEKNAELRVEVEKYLNKMVKNHRLKTNKFIYDLKRAIDGKIPLEDVSPTTGYTTNAFVVTTFQKYVNDPGWELVNIEALKQLGIVAISNTITKQIDFIALSHHDLHTELKLSLGTTMLGEHEKDAYALNNKMILLATNGNIELMKIMAAINEIPNALTDVFKIGDIKVINTEDSKATTATSRQIKETFNLLAKAAKVNNNINKLSFMDELDVIKNEFLALMNRPNGKLTNSLSRDIEALSKELFNINTVNKNEIANRLIALARRMENGERLGKIVGGSLESIANESSNTGIERLYKSILQAIAYYKGLDFLQPKEISRYTQKGTPLSGGMITNPDLFPEDNLRQITLAVRGAFDNVTREMTPYHEKFLTGYVKPLWKDKGYSNARNIVIGDQVKLYNNFFRRNSDGSLNNKMLFVDPYDSSTPLTSEERRFLKQALWLINQERFPNIRSLSEDSETVKQLKKTEKWFWVPLMEANNQILQMGISKWINQEVKDVTGRFKDYWNRSQNDAYSDREYSDKQKVITRYEMYNRFNLSEASEEARDALLAEYKPDFWERNIETLVTTYKFASARKEQLDIILPAIKGIKMSLLGYAKSTDTDLSVLNETLDNYLKVAVFNQSIISEEGRQAFKYLNPIKRLASFGLLAFNVTGGVRDMINGMWKQSSLAFSKMYYTDEKFTRKDLAQAMALVTKEGPDMLSRTTKIEAINNMIRLANIDMQVLNKRLISNKSGLANMSRHAYQLTTAPDYFHRMTIFVAQCLHDGTWDALEMTDEGIKYNWKKDKRLAVYASGNKSNPEYNKQRGLYLSIMEAYNRDNGLNLKEGDDLPFAYTKDEVLAAKTLSDLIYGHYDQESRALAEKTFMGALFGQFKTYLSATRNAYLLKPKNYNLAGRVQAKNDNGDLLWYKDEVDENGNSIVIVTTENTGVPATINEDRYLEGIYYTIKDCFRALHEGGFSEFRDSIWNEETGVKKANLKRLAHDMFLWMILGTIGKYLIELWGETREEDRDPLNPNMSQAMRDTVFSLFEGGYNSSYGDIAPWSVLLGLIKNSEPVSIGYLSTFFNNTYEFAFGDKSLSSYLTGTTGLGRTFKGMTTELNNMSKLAADAIEEDTAQ